MQTTPEITEKAAAGQNSCKLKINLSNDFHGTTTTILARVTDPSFTIIYGRRVIAAVINRRQMRAAYGRLCGHRDCLCGGVCGKENPDITPCQDGGAMLYQIV